MRECYVPMQLGIVIANGIGDILDHHHIKPGFVTYFHGENNIDNAGIIRGGGTPFESIDLFIVDPVREYKLLFATLKDFTVPVVIHTHGFL